MSKLIHVLVLAGFGYGCLFIWVLLSLAAEATRGASLPAFTRWCVNMRPALFALPVMAAAYCAWACSRRSEKVPHWVGFFAAAAGVLVLVGLPAGLAAYLPLMPL